MRDLWKNLLRGLLKANRLAWRREHQEVFESLKEGLSSDTVLVCLDPTAEHEVHVDGCLLGISATSVLRESSNRLAGGAICNQGPLRCGTELLSN